MLNKHRQTAANDRVSAFVNSQRGLMSYYVAEGQVNSASWQATFGDLRPQSPMLIPRAAATKGDGLRTNARCATPDKSGLSFPIDLPKPSNPILKPDLKPNQDHPSEITRSTPDKSVSSQPKQIARESSPEVESEHLQRLAQRRNRRRARRVAMTSVGAPNESSAKDKRRSSKKRPNTDAGENKQRKKKATPALLLMQNFSSQSLGKSRLTIKPSPTVGVFNKGKASAKVVANDRRNKLAGRSKSDIVFSESRFLNKAQSVRSESGAPEDDSDYSDNPSDHSMRVRAGRRAAQKDSLSNPRASSVADHTSAQGSPARSLPSGCEDSPPWDVEQRLSSPISFEPVDTSPAQAPVRPRAKKDVIVEVARCGWASRLKQPDSHIPPLQANTGAKPTSSIDKPLAQPSTTSAYFQVPPAPMEHQIPIVSPLGIPRLVSEPPIQDANQHTMAPPDAYNPPSTPECLQLEPPNLDSGHGAHYIHIPTVCLSPRPPESDFQEGQNIGEWYLEETPGDEGLWDSEGPGRFKRVELDEYWFDDTCEEDQGNIAFEGFPVRESALYDERPESIYGDNVSLPHDGVEELHGVYREGEVDYHDALGKEECTREELPRCGLVELSTTTWDEEPSLVRDEWYNIDEDQHVPAQWDSILSTEYGMEELDPDDESVEHGELECGPRLVRVVTEESLQDELLKSMNSHWRSAHRLY